MKTTNICPKCGGSDIIKIDGTVRAYGGGNNIQVGMSIFSAIPVDRYLCCTCGYSEEWIDRDALPKVRKKYKN